MRWPVSFNKGGVTTIVIGARLLGRLNTSKQLQMSSKRICVLLMQEMEGELKRLRNHRSDQVYDVAYVQVCKHANASKPPSTHKMLGSKYDNSQGLLLVYDVLTELDDYAVETFSDDEVIFG